MTTQREFGRLFETLRGERRNDLSNDDFLVLSESLYALAISKLVLPHERHNLVKTASASLHGQVRTITGEAAPFPRIPIQ